MSNELVKNDYTNLPVSTVSRSELRATAQETEFLGRFQLYTKGEAIDSGAIAPGHYGVPQNGSDEILDLGNEIDILVVAVRYKAMDVSDRDDVIVSYDKDSDVYKDIKSRSDNREQGCLYGFSFLTYERSTNSFYEMFCCNKSARIFAPTLLPFLPLSAAEAEQSNEEPHGPIPATLGVRYASNSKGKWHVPQVRECKEPFTREPPMDEVIRQVTKFLTPEEEVEEDSRGRDR